MNFTTQLSSRGKQGSAADLKAEKKAKLDSLFNPEPIAEIAVELPNNDESQDEMAVNTSKDLQAPQLNKKKQAKAEKKKEAKQNLKMKAQQKKQEEAEMKA